MRLPKTRQSAILNFFIILHTCLITAHAAVESAFQSNTLHPHHRQSGPWQKNPQEQYHDSKIGSFLLPTTKITTLSKQKEAPQRKAPILFSSSKKNTKSKGVYSRPSAAIEKGSGFYIPGLEGSRVRILFGIVLLILTFLNHFYSPVVDAFDTLVVSEWVALVYGVLLIGLGSIEFGKELGFGVITTSADGEKKSGGVNAASSALEGEKKKDVSQFADVEVLSASSVEALNWVSASYMSLTSATNVLFLSEKDAKVIYRLGEDGQDSSEEAAIIKTAIDTVKESRGGRISIPSDHPCSTALLPENSRRCVVLQIIPSGDDVYCLMVGSDQLLQTFTKNDLRWLGRLAVYAGIALEKEASS